MASVTGILSFLLMACKTLAQMVPMDPACSASSSNALTPFITLTYTPFMAPQIGPTSTVYQAIVTTYYNIIFCGRGTPTATVTNVQANPAPSGPFTTKTTIPVLTVTAVDCMPSDTVVTRREVRGFDYFKRSVTKTDIETKTTATYGPPKHPQLNPWFEGIPIPPGWKQGHPLQELKVASHLKAKREAVPTLSPQAAALVEELQTAQYGLELCNSDFNLTEICEQLRDPEAIVPLANVGISSSQASDIACFCSVYGIDLNTTNAALLGDLAAAVYGLELGDNFTTTTNATKLCNNIDLTAAPYLGIDAGAVNNFICGGPSSIVTTTTVSTETIIVVPGSPTVTFTASGVGASGSFPSPSGIGASSGFPLPSGIATGGPNGWPNGTFPQATASGSVVSGGTAVSGAASATGAGRPWGNSTGNDTIGIQFPKASEEPDRHTHKTPVAPDTPQYYPANTVRTTITASWGGYA